MSATLLLLGPVLAASPTPSPTSEELDPLSVSPGLVGFLATFAIAVATVLLVLDMVRRLRRMRFRQDQERRPEEEAAARAAADGHDQPAPGTPQAQPGRPDEHGPPPAS